MGAEVENRAQSCPIVPKKTSHGSGIVTSLNRYMGGRKEGVWNFGF